MLLPYVCLDGCHVGRKRAWWRGAGTAAFGLELELKAEQCDIEISSYYTLLRLSSVLD